MLYKSVLKKAEEINYKKGIVRVDTSSGVYKASKVLYYISFAWFMLFHGLYLLSNSTAFFFYETAAKNIHTELFVTSIAVFVLIIVGIVSVKHKWHIAAFASTVVATVAQMVALYSNDNISLAFISGIFNNKFFWFHFAPAILLILFVTIIFAIGLKTTVQTRKDYNRALASMYEKYSLENPNVSATDWQEYLKELDRKLEEGNDNGDA